MSSLNPFTYVEKGVRSVGNSLGKAGKAIIQGTANVVGDGVGYLHQGTGTFILIQEMQSKKEDNTQEMLSMQDQKLSETWLQWHQEWLETALMPLKREKVYQKCQRTSQIN